MLIFAALMLSVGVSFAQPACPSNGYFHNCFGTYTFANEDTYTGEWKDGKKNGQGTYTFANGDTYAGEWSGDKKNGQGTYTFANGDTYSGEWEWRRKERTRHLHFC